MEFHSTRSCREKDDVEEATSLLALDQRRVDGLRRSRMRSASNRIDFCDILHKAERRSFAINRSRDGEIYRYFTNQICFEKDEGKQRSRRQPSSTP